MVHGRNFFKSPMLSMGTLGALLARNASSFLVFLSISNRGSISLETGISGSILKQSECAKYEKLSSFPYTDNTTYEKEHEMPQSTVCFLVLDNGFSQIFCQSYNVIKCR